MNPYLCCLLFPFVFSLSTPTNTSTRTCDRVGMHATVCQQRFFRALAAFLVCSPPPLADPIQQISILYSEALNALTFDTDAYARARVCAHATTRARSVPALRDVLQLILAIEFSPCSL